MSKSGSSKGGSSKPTPQPQSAITGQYVTQAYADKHPKTTVTITPKPTKKS